MVNSCANSDLARSSIERAGLNTTSYDLRRSLAPALVLFALTLTALTAQPAAAAGRCNKPIAWRIGVVDRQFNIDRATLERMAKVAARRWNKVAGRTLFTYQSNAHFTINLKYGLRQQTAEALQDLRTDTTQREDLLGDMKAMVRKLMRKYETDAANYRSVSREYERETKTFNAHARQRRLSASERDALLGVRDALTEQRTLLNQWRKRLDQSYEEIRDLNRAINTRVAQHNDSVTRANRTVNELPADALKLGVTHINGTRTKIDLFQYYDDKTLYITLLHELGHALGLQHIGDRRAIMHATRTQKTAQDLTRSDVLALQQLCKRRRR